MSNDEVIARAMARLRAPGSPELGALVDLLIDAAMARPIETAVDADRVVQATIQVLQAERVERALRELVRPAWERQQALVEKRGDRVAEWLPEGGAELLDEVLAGARLPRGAWAKKIVDTADLRELVAPVLQDTLLSFAKKLPLVGGGDDGAPGAAAGAAGKLFGLAKGIADKASERAGKLADIGRGVLGGIGGEMEKRIHASARDFSQGAFEPLEASFTARLRSEEGRVILDRMRGKAVRQILAAPAAEIASDLDTLPREALDRLLARAIAFAASRPELAEMLRAEVTAFVRDHAGKTAGEALAAWGLRELAVRELRAELLVIAGQAAADGRAEAWLRDLLRP